MSENQLAPWLARTLDTITHSFQQERLTHALMVDSVPGWGLYELVPHVVSTILSIDDQASINHHLDYMLIQRAEKSRGKGKDKLKIEQIKEALDFLLATPIQAERRLVVIEEAEALTIPATQALLKILEEPPANKHIVLFTTDGGLLPPTIRSRCHRFGVQRGSIEEVEQYLASQVEDVAELRSYLTDFGGAPFRTLDAYRAKSFNLTAALAQFVRNQRTLVETAELLIKNEDDPHDTLMRWQYAALRFAQNAKLVEPVACFYDELTDLKRQIHEAAGLHNTRQYLRLLIKWQALVQSHQAQRR